MSLNADSRRFAQHALKRKRMYTGPIDGLLNPSFTAVVKRYPGLPTAWPVERKVVGLIQLLATEAGIDAGAIDGRWGPQTQFGYDSLVALRLYGVPTEPWRPEDRLDVNPNNWPSQRSDAELIAHFGPVDTNQKRIALPYPHRIAWDPDKVVHRYSCHALVHDSLLRVLTHVLDIYGLPDIQRLRLDQWGGCLNKRKMRGGDRWSTHAWGIAVDYDPANNQLRWGADRASLAGAEYAPWWRCWEEEGWLSLGRARNFDWMHVQAAKL
ncbi:MAG: hypothetical protein KA175_02760 [Flavobacteriales bacterium]|nr:hypothetical protein [Flavobacteriales bacterium]MBP6696511.1 hypothetical protein [Flavobacteriales bacterium]